MTKVETTVGKALLAQSYSAQAQAWRLMPPTSRASANHGAGSQLRQARPEVEGSTKTGGMPGRGP